MSSPAGMPPGFTPWQNTQPQPPPVAPDNVANEDGVSVRPMRLKVLYTFDDQNKTNCLARWPHVLDIQTVAMDETASIGVIELKTCIQAIVQCSPELLSRLGQDYTVYAYDYSEYDNPLVGQGMLSWALAAASPTPGAPAQQSRQLITGRVCKNILGIFSNGVKETLEVKLRLVPVPTVLQSEYMNTMEKYRGLNQAPSNAFDANEWSSFLQSNPNMPQMPNKITIPQSSNISQRDGMSMEVVNQLLSPHLQQQPNRDPFNQMDTGNQGNDDKGNTTAGGKPKASSRPSSRASVKRPRARKPKAATAAGGNTSGYEEGTDGDDGPAPKRRAKVTKADKNINSPFAGEPDSLRVAASTAGSLRLFRPIAMSPHPQPGAGSHLQEIPRAPTPVPQLPNQHAHRDRAPSQSALRRDSIVSQVEQQSQPHVSPYSLLRPEDQVRYSIESAGPSPERNPSPVDTPPDIGSSPPLMRTRPPSLIRSSPPCPSSPLLPEMPRTDSGFMSGSLEDLFGEDDETMNNEKEVELPAHNQNRSGRRISTPLEEAHQGFAIQEVNPGPMDLLPTRMPVIEHPKQIESKARAAISRAGSVMSEDGQVLPPLKNNKPASRRPTITHAQRAPTQRLKSQTPTVDPIPVDNRASGYEFPPSDVQQGLQQQQSAQTAPPPVAPRPRSGSRMMVRTASMGSLTLPAIPASDPALPPSNLQRSQTWSEVPHPMTEAPMPPVPDMTSMSQMPNGSNIPSFNRALTAKKASIKQKLELAIANGEMPPFCSNCGAIETSTWRKAWSQEHKGEPGYYEYSDEPGRVTAVIVLSRDEQGKPTSYQIIKKFLLQEENQDDFKEFLLCNPCGIWMSKYKTQRPESRWESTPQDRPANGQKKRPTQRPSKPKNSQNQNIMMPTSEANFPPSEANFPPSEANFPQSEANHPQYESMGPPEGISPSDTTGMQGSQPQGDGQRRGSIRPMKRINAMTSDAASAALRRAIKSSPARWAGTQHSPIDVEDDMGSTRRLLFPSPRKDGSPKVLGEITTNVVTIATTFHSPKEQMVETQNKENCPPAIEADDVDAELLRLFEEEMAKGSEIARPSTPTGKSPPTNPFKTPTRQTPSHRPVTRSVSRSIRSARSAKSPSQLLTFTRTPSQTPGVRRSPRHHDHVFESPFTATLNQLMSEANNQQTSPARNGMELDFGTLPPLPNINQNQNMDMNFSLEDFFSTDVPMPSSPPRMFNLYEDPAAMANINWEEFGKFGPKDLDKSGEEVVVKQEEDETMDLGDDSEGGEEQQA
ncbi:hypothetical protein V8E51_009367 [Hyaloscypha variabilis]